MVVAALVMPAVALPPMDLHAALGGSMSPAAIEGGGWAYRAQVDLDRGGVETVVGPDGLYVVFDLVVSIGRDTLEMPTVSHRAGRIQYRIGRPRYSLMVFADVGGDVVRAGDLGAPVGGLAPVSSFGLPLGVDLTEDTEIHHRIAVRVERVASRGQIQFPIRYSLIRQNASMAPARQPVLDRPLLNGLPSRPVTLKPTKTHRR